MGNSNSLIHPMFQSVVTQELLDDLNKSANKNPKEKVFHRREWGSGRTWDINFASMAEFYRENGHFKLPGAPVAMRSLSQWCANQRRQKKSGLLSSDRCRQLDEIGFPWDVTRGRFLIRTVKPEHSKVDRWDIRYQAIKGFYERYGHVSVPTRNQGVFSKLYGYTMSFRHAIRFGALSSDYMKKLSDIGFFDKRVKTENPDKNLRWTYFYSQLYAAYEKDGALSFQASLALDDDLCRWCRAQRYAKKRGVLSAEQINKLDQIKFAWVSGQKNESWQLYYNKLSCFYQSTKHCVVPASNLTLYRWCDRQRSAQRCGALSPLKKSLLDELDFQWASIHENWLKSYAQFVGAVPLAGKNKISQALRGWANRHIKRYKSGRLSQECVRLMDEVRFETAFSGLNLVTSPMRRDWTVKYAHFVDVIRSDDKQKMPAPLRAWAVQQVKRYKSGRLHPECIKLMDQVDFERSLAKLKSMRRLKA